MKLDRSRPFGTVHGAHHGAVTFQNGHYFDVNDNYVISNEDVAAPAPGDPDAASAEAPAPMSGMTKEQTLNQLTVGQLKTLVIKAGGEPVLGSGAKAKMVAWLIENTQ